MERADILIIGSKVCDHVDAMVQALLNRGANPVVFDTRCFPIDNTITFNPASDTVLKVDGHYYSMSEFRSVYWRTLFGAAPRTTGNKDIDCISWQDSESLLHSLLCAQGPRWFNSYHAWSMHKLKPVQLAKIAALGIPIPDTCLTNDTGAATQFYTEQKNLIHKPVFGGSETQRVSPPLMCSKRLTEVFAHSPVTLQRCIEGINLRTFVIGNTVFSIEIRAKSIDFRADPEHQVRLIPVTHRLRNWSLQICKELDMNWTAIDWRLNQQNNPVFLEANPSPMFVGLSHRLKIDISGMLADELMKKDHATV